MLLLNSSLKLIALIDCNSLKYGKNGSRCTQDFICHIFSVAGGTRKRKRKLGDMIKDATANGRFLMGNAALTKLWNICPDNLEACASIERDFLPSVEDYFAEAIEQLDPANQVEETYK
jgi:hypothetical protein